MRDRLLDLPVAEIVSRIRAGDQPLYETLFSAYWGPLYRVAFAMMHDSADAEELVVHVLSSVWERRATWDVRGSLESYLATAIRNQARMVWRSEARRQRLTQQYVAPGESPAMGQPLSPDAEVEVDRMLAAETAIEALPERYRLAVRYRWYEHRSYEDIAALMAISPGAVRILVSRALTLVRTALND